MFDTNVRIVIDPWLNALAKKLTALGIDANSVTWAGFVLGVCAAIAIVFGAYWFGLALILVSRICDGLDGAVARAGSEGNTDLGGFLDIVLDFGFYAFIPLAFIIADPVANSLAGSILLTTFYINGASFLTYALMAEKRGIDPDAKGNKSLLYTTGLTEATETIIVFVLFCLFPQWFSTIAAIFAAMVVWTTISRFVLAYRSLT